MYNDENIQRNQKENTDNIQKQQSVYNKETSVSNKQTVNKFPEWDILPPIQFINPRIRKVE